MVAIQRPRGPAPAPVVALAAVPGRPVLVLVKVTVGVGLGVGGALVGKECLAGGGEDRAGGGRTAQNRGMGGGGTLDRWAKG